MDKTTNPEWDLIVIGGGVAGMTAAQYGSRANLRTLVFEEMAPGGQALLINEMENYPGFPESVNGYEFSDAMRRQTENFGASFKTATVKSLIKEGNIFTVKTGTESVGSWTAVLATGAKHKHLGVRGEEEFTGRGVSYCATCDGPLFKNKKILVVGGGDAACDEASYLANLSDKVVMIHRRNRFRAQKILADRVQRNPNIEVRLSHILEEIEGDAKVQSVVLKNVNSGESYKEQMDAVFIFIGSIPQTDLVKDLEKDDGGYLLTNQSMETSLKGLFAVGDVRATPFRQVVVACGEGAVAAHAASAHIDDLKGESYV